MVLLKELFLLKLLGGSAMELEDASEMEKSNVQR